jgi:hypothetical protein
MNSFGHFNLIGNTRKHPKLCHKTCFYVNTKNIFFKIIKTYKNHIVVVVFVLNKESINLLLPFANV